MTRNSRVELYAAIRRDARAGLSGREIQRKHGVGWRTVQSALTSAWPQQRAAYPTRASKLDGFKPAIDDILRSDLNAPRKQRHTVTRIVDRLRTEFGMDDVSYPVVRAYVATRRPEISIECGRGAPMGCSFRKPICPAAKPKSTLVRSACGYVANSPPATCSPYGCRTRAKLFIVPLQPEARRRSSKATCMRSRSSAECPPARSATTTSKPLWHR